MLVPKRCQQARRQKNKYYDKKEKSKAITPADRVMVKICYVEGQQNVGDKLESCPYIVVKKQPVIHVEVVLQRRQGWWSGLSQLSNKVYVLPSGTSQGASIVGRRKCVKRTQGRLEVGFSRLVEGSLEDAQPKTAGIQH